MRNRENSKITNMHLSKIAILYIRQSTIRQVYENNESTMRQYALKDRLIALGWPAERVVIIDQDLGKSGAEAQNRSGFQTLVGDVSNNLVGAVACLECSRLSRSSADWSRLTQYCAYTNTLLIDADGIYDPNDFNDRLLLGLKATMSECELHFLQERMRGGLMNKAKRGELKRPIPIGYVYDDDRVIKDPDIEVQNAVEMLFDSFRRKGSAHGVVEHFKFKGYKFPYKIGKGFRKGEVEWINLELGHALNTLHNPYYAGVYSYGRTQMVWTSEGKKQKAMPREDWHVFIKDHHAAYVTFEEFEENERILSENNTQRKSPDQRTPPREGPALIQGLVWCGKCNQRMTVRYNHYSEQPIPIYICQKLSVDKAEKVCQIVPGKVVDEKITELLLSRLTPEVVGQAMSVQKELDKRQAETLNYYQMRVDKCIYDAELARRRFMNVDPDNRLVALELESSWNIKLKDLDNARGEYDNQVEKAERTSNARDYSLIDNLAENFTEVFSSRSVSFKDKKRMVRHLIEDVTLVRNGTSINVQIRYKGRTTQSVMVDAPKPSCESWTTNPEVIELINQAAETSFVEDIADLLAQRGFNSGKGWPFTANIVKRIMYAYSIPNLKERYLDKGYITSVARASELGITSSNLMYMIREGKYQGEYIRVNSKNECVFPPGQEKEVNHV
jgi:DNA invertase Pin-like site-specific DNA recombinase